MNVTSALHVPEGTLNLNVFSLEFHMPKACPAEASFMLLELAGTLKFPCSYQLKNKI